MNKNRWAIFGVVMLVGLCLNPMTVSAAPEPYTVQTVYFVPSDSSYRGSAEARANNLVAATRRIQQQWSSWGLTFKLGSEPYIIYSDKPISYFNCNSETGSRVLDEAHALGMPNDNKVKWNIFTDEVADCRTGAYATGSHARFWGGITNDAILELFDNNRSNQDGTGAIGHEMGHNFGVTHENCDGNTIGELVERELPTYQKKSFMCSGGNWPNVNPPEPWQIARMQSTGCPWFSECKSSNIIKAQPGTFSLRFAHSNKCLDYRDGMLRQQPCDNSANQTFTERSKDFGVQLVASDGRCVGAGNNLWAWPAERNGTEMGLRDCLDERNVYAQFQKIGQSYRYAAGTRCLDAPNFTSANGSVVKQFWCNGSAAQKLIRSTVSQPASSAAYTVVNAKSNKCMETSGGGRANNTNISQYGCNNTGAQKWEEVAASGGFMLRNPQSGKCLDVENASHNNGTNVQLYTCMSLPSQILNWQGNTLRFKHSGKCLDVSGASTANGANLQQWSCVDTPAQYFGKNSAPSTSQPNPTTPSNLTPYTVVNAKSNKCMETKGGGRKNRTNITQYSCNNTGAQKWEEVAASGGFMLRNPQSGKCLDVDNASHNNGTNVQLYTCMSLPSQILNWQGNTLRFKHSGKCLDVSGASTANGANLQQWSCVDTPAQYFGKNSAPSTSQPNPTAPSILTSYTVVNAKSYKCMETKGGGRENRTNITQYSCNNTGAQKWEQVAASGGFMLRNPQSGKCLDVDNASHNNGTNVQLYTCMSLPSQILNWQGNTLRFKHSGKCLDVSGASTANGANLQQWGCVDTLAQYFGKNSAPSTAARSKNLSLDTTITLNNSGHLVVDIVPSDPNAGEGAAYEVLTTTDSDFLSVTGQFDARPESGNLRFELIGEFFNRTMDGGPESGKPTDNVKIEVVLNLAPSINSSNAHYCIKYQDTNGDSQPVLPSGEQCFATDITIEPNTQYTISAGIDRDRQELIVGINNLEIREESPYPFFDQAEGGDHNYAGFNVTDGAPFGSFVMSDLNTGGESLELSNLLDTSRSVRTGVGGIGLFFLAVLSLSAAGFRIAKKRDGI